jgi:hypothetical protein
MEMRVFWSVLCALLVFSGISAVWYALSVRAREHAVVAVMQQVSAEAQQEELKAHVQSELDRIAADDRARREHARYVLAPDQRCVGGVVIQVRGNSYTQVGSIVSPVHCLGRVADRPLR